MAEKSTVGKTAVTGKRQVRSDGPVMKSYTPSLRERAQIGGEQLFQKVTGRAPGYWDRRQIEKLSGLLDFVPIVGDALGVDETKRALDRKRWVEAGLTGLGTVVGAVPVVGDAVGGALRASAKAAERATVKAAEKGALQTAKVAERAAPKATERATTELKAKYADPTSTRIEDWTWRPQEDVKAELGLSTTPEHVLNYGRFMDDQAARAAAGGMSARDLLKAYGITRSSMQRQAIPLQTAQKYGLDLEHLGLKEVRPEGAFSELLGTPSGQAYLDAAQRGQVNESAIADMAAKFRPYGFHNSLAQDLEWGARNLPQHSSQVADMVAAAREGASNPEDWVRFVKDKVRGVDAAKAGFVGAMLGRGDLPTLDARQIILQTGRPTKEASKFLSRGSGTGAVEALQRLAARMQDLGIPLPAELEPYRQHLTHHAVWDKAANEATTHEDVMNALRNYAKGGLVAKYGC